MIRDNKGYKKGCQWRNSLDDVCSFKPKDCNSKSCDMFDINFNVEDVQSKLEFEKKNIIGLNKKVLKLKKNNKNYEEDKEFKKYQKQIADKFLGMIYLAEALDKLSGNKYSKWAKKYPRLAKKLKSKAVGELEKFKKKLNGDTQ